ncbi:hypothetical protein CAPTEDRAFT_200683 [Capitella teleta]|uniref:Uncharacterized protein n=1 Tax=Capitella teleta TaxID=283909 RepID=R7UM74_CAPTE|nr:hypothetical protein CAPTEDRAFT_200683 [Capitella teleta]|eukprot:ELU07614.1 hypothetical protein CAPTEDRAFT_200683 [Capitella teleta]
MSDMERLEIIASQRMETCGRPIDELPQDAIATFANVSSAYTYTQPAICVLLRKLLTLHVTTHSLEFTSITRIRKKSNNSPILLKTPVATSSDAQTLLNAANTTKGDDILPKDIRCPLSRLKEDQARQATEIIQ